MKTRSRVFVLALVVAAALSLATLLVTAVSSRSTIYDTSIPNRQSPSTAQFTAVLGQTNSVNCVSQILSVT